MKWLYQRIDLENSLINQIHHFKNKFNYMKCEYPNKIIMSYDLFKKLEEESCKNCTPVRTKNTIFGMEFEIDDKLDNDIVKLVKESEFMVKNPFESWYIDTDIALTKNMSDKKWFVNNSKPKKYIINKGATILFWEDGTKTIVKRGKDDEYDKVKGFLWAYFQKHCGLSKTKANEYLASLVDEDELKAIKMIENGELNDTLGNICDSISNTFKNMADRLKNKE